MISNLYRLLTDLGAPFISLYLRRRLQAGREDAERFAERLGQPSLERPPGRLVWCHAASVGEAASLMLLIDALHAQYPGLQFLLTTGTVTAAKLMGPRLKFYARHQYMPVDRLPYVKSFLSHWRPDLVIWIESELWPNILGEVRKRGTPAILLNARMSDRSFRGWHRVKDFAQELLSVFTLCLAQTESDRSRYVALGVNKAKYVGNLKYASVPLPADAAQLEQARLALAGRPCWLMASTHRGEEEMAIAAHKKLTATHPGLVTVIAPRHAARGDEVARIIEAAGLKVARRSKNDTINADTQIYLADTMGELGLLYRLCPVSVIGGSFARNAGIAGHNPIEPAHLESAIIFGPLMQNFAEIAREFTGENAALQISHENEIAFAVGRLLDDAGERNRLTKAARALADGKRHILERIIDELKPWLLP